MTKIGILHPGEMGVSIAAAAVHSGHQVYWASEGRSEKTRQRAEKYELSGMESLTDLCQTCEVLISICPPHAAEDIARSVTGTEFKGVYLDANAISPQHSIRIGQLLEAKGIPYVDGGIIGGPTRNPKETWLYLSGQYANVIADCFSKGPLETKFIGEEIGKASALKMCYAAYSKGTTALLVALLATAESLGVRKELYEQWDFDDADFSEQINGRVTRAAAKAWRFEGEMLEIASTFKEAGLPDGFHKTAAEIYHLMAKLKNINTTHDIDELLEIVRGAA